MSHGIVFIPGVGAFTIINEATAEIEGITVARLCLLENLLNEGCKYRVILYQFKNGPEIMMNLGYEEDEYHLAGTAFTDIVANDFEDPGAEYYYNG